MALSAADLTIHATAAAESAAQAAWWSLPAYWLGTIASVAVVIAAFLIQRSQRRDLLESQKRQAEIDEERRLRARHEMAIGALSACARGAQAMRGCLYRCEHETDALQHFSKWANDLDFQESVVCYYLDRDIDDVDVVTILLSARSLLARARSCLKEALNVSEDDFPMPLLHLKDSVELLWVQSTTHEV